MFRASLSVVLAAAMVIVQAGCASHDAGEHKVGTVLEVLVRRVGLEGRIDLKTGKPVWVWGHADAELQMRMDVDVRLVNASDGEVLYTHAFRALGDARKFSAWAADDGRGFHDGVPQACEDVAGQVLFPAP